MKGLLKTKPAGSQFLLLISIALASFFIVGLIGTVILGRMAGMGLTEMSEPSKWDYSKDGTIFLLRGMQVVQFVALFLIPVFLCAWLFSTDSKKYLGLKKPSSASYFIVGVGVMLLAIPATIFIGELNRNMQFPSGIANWIKKSEDGATKIEQALLSKHTIKDLFINLVCIAGLAAVGEELLFRGMAQRLLIKMFKSPWAGIVVAAILFSAIHMQFYGFLPRLVLGILLGIIYWYSGSLWVAMLAHFAYDAFLIIVIYFSPEMQHDENTAKLSGMALMAAVSTALVIAGIGWMKKKSTVTYSEVYADDILVKNHPFDFE